MNDNHDEIEIDLREVFAAIMHSLWLIILVTFVFGAVTFVYSKFVITPTYESQTQIYIQSKQNSNNLTYSDVQLSSQLTKDYAQLITSRHVVEQVIENFGLDLTYEQFVGKVKVVTPSDTRIIKITVTDPDPVFAKNLVDDVREVASIHITNVMDAEAVKTVDEGNVATNPANPSVPKWTLLGLVLGAFLSVGIVLVKYLLDDTIKTTEDVEKYLGLSTLALIPITTIVSDTNADDDMDDMEMNPESLRKVKSTLEKSKPRAQQDDELEITDIANDK